MKLQIKPFSVNDAWNTYCSRCRQAKTVRRTKTNEYKAYYKHLTLLLPPLKLNFNGSLKISIVFGFSSVASDIDNPLKPLIDCMQKKYGFNDNQIYELNVKKDIVQKGNEFINLEIIEL